MSEEVKKPTSLKIRLKLMGEDDSVIQFKIKMHSTFKKLMKAYGERTGKSPEVLKFDYEGTEITPKDTPADLYMEDGDIIQVFHLTSDTPY